MKPVTLDYLTLDEINFLAEIAGIKKIYGIPIEPQATDENKEKMKSPKDSLIEKGVLLPSYSLAESAKLIIHALEEYSNANKYAHFVHLLVGITDDTDMVSVITILEKDSKYRVQLLEKKHVLFILCKSFDIFKHNPTDEELTFAQKELSSERLNHIRELNIYDIELFQIDVTSKERRTVILYFIDEGDIIRWDFAKKEFTLASSYFMNKELCDALNIPILDKEEA